MRVVLDTECWIWLALAPERLSEATRTLIETPTTEILLSAASAWEIAIKYAKGKLLLPEPPDAYIEARLRRTHTSPLPITHRHAIAAGALPRHHRDPFDRLIIAQATLERVPIITTDSMLRRYDVEIIAP